MTDMNATQKYVDTHDVSLRDYFEMRIDALEKNLSERFVAQEKSVLVALHANDRRLDGMNEFRATLEDQSKSQVTAIEFVTYREMQDKTIEAMAKQIDSLRISRAQMDGKASQTQLFITMGISVISLVLSILKFLIP